MRVYTTDKQLKHLKQKGIIISPKDKKKFKKYNYFQVINAYKHIFIEKIYTIEEIESLVNNGNQEMIAFLSKYYNVKIVESAPFLLNVSNEIIKKYDFTYKHQNYDDNKDLIKKKKYVLHRYHQGTTYGDFLQLLKFEHQLRNILIKYILIIEENIKNVFCNYLNDNTHDAYFLLNINNFRVHDNTKYVINTMNKIYNKFTINDNKPLKRKNEQKVLPPYWMIIPTFTLRELLLTINNLNDCDNIIKELMYLFTEYFTKQNEPTLDEIGTFRKNLDRIGTFRNLLAHNEPITRYNVIGNMWDIDVVFSGVVKRKKNEDDKVFKKRNSARLNETFDFIDKAFKCNSREAISYNSRNINLAYITYLIGKIIQTIDPNSDYKYEVQKCYHDFQIIQHINLPSKIVDLTEMEKIENLLLKIEEFTGQLDFNDLETTLLENKPYRKKLNSMKKNKKEIEKKLLLISNEKKKILKKTLPNYPIFKYQNEYKKYTGIDLKFLKNM